jgi:hypothetical protein
VLHRLQVTETSGIARFKTVMRMAQAQIDGEKQMTKEAESIVRGHQYDYQIGT